MKVTFQEGPKIATDFCSGGKECSVLLRVLSGSDTLQGTDK